MKPMESNIEGNKAYRYDLDDCELTLRGVSKQN